MLNVDFIWFVLTSTTPVLTLWLIIESALHKKTSGICLGVILLTLFTVNEGKYEQVTPPYTVYFENVLVSASPSSLRTEGAISGSFLFFSGYTSQSRYYLLREEISKGLYKDFEVKGEVYIRESDEHTPKGLFTSKTTCVDTLPKYTFFDIVTWKGVVSTKCEPSRKEIIVPRGSVIKELKI